MFETNKNYKWWVLIAMCLGLVMENLDISIVNLAVPDIAKSLQTGLSQMQWVLNAYLVLGAIFMVIGGRLGDILGQFRVLWIATFIFTLASFFCAFSPNADSLIASRALQGIGFGMSLPLIVAINFYVFPVNQRALVISIGMAVSGIAQIMGPFLGGLLLQFWSWHSVFLINLPVGVLGLLLIWLVMPKKPLIGERETIDWIGAALFILSLLSILIALTEVSAWGITSWTFLLCMTFGILLFAVFILVEQKRKHPLIDLNLFKIKIYWQSSLIRILCSFIYCSFLFLMPLYLQSILGKTPFWSGMIFLLMNVGYAGMSIFNDKLLSVFGEKKSLAISFILYFVSLVTTVIAVVVDNNWLLYVSLLVQGMTTSIMIVTTATVALGAVSKEKSGLASGVFYTISTLGFSVSIAAVGSLLVSVSNLYLFKKINDMTLTAAQFFKLQAAAQGIHSLKALAEIFPAKLAHTMIVLAHHAFILGFVGAMILNMILVGMAALLLRRVDT